MNKRIERRDMMKIGAAAAVGMAVARPAAGWLAGEGARPVRVGVVGTGNRGRSLLATMLQMKGLTFPALCDINRDNLAAAQDQAVKAGHPKPEGYSKNEESFRELMARDDIDAVIIATYWNWHTPMAVAGMRSGKYVGVEVPAAI